MSKKDEALKLALEALEKALRYHGVMLLSDPPQDAWKYHRVEQTAHEAITAIREALAEQQMEAPCRCGKQSVAWCVASGCSKAEQRPSIRVNLDMTGAMATLPKTGSESVVDYKPVISDAGADANIPAIPGTYYGIIPKGTGKITVTNGVQRKPWVGLTDEDLAGCDDEELKQARYWEAKLREKNK